MFFYRYVLSIALYEYAETVNTDVMEQLNRNAKEKWKMLIRYGIKRGEFREVNIDELVNVIMYSYQGTNQKEIDIVLEENGKLHPLEIKKSSNPEKKAISSFHLLEKSSLKIGEGGIICMAAKPFPLDENNSIIPCNII